MRITVMGGGNSAQTMAADLTLRGFAVTLFDLPQYEVNIERALQTKSLEMYGSIDTTGPTGLAKLSDVTTDIKRAMAQADAIFIAVPAYAHMAFFAAMAPNLRDGQVVVTMPGNWGALRFYNYLRRQGSAARVHIAETSLCMHICRAAEPFLGPGKVRVILERQTVQIAAVPATDTAAVAARLQPVYPILVPAQNVIETALNNGNIIGHGPLVLMNAGWLEHTGGQFMIYRDGVTPSVGRVTDAIAAERDRIAKALGFKTSPPYSTYEDIKGSRWVLDPCEIGPPDLEHRYLSEDMPYGLVPLACLGDLLGIDTPLTDAMVNMAGTANQVDYWRDGMNLRQLEIDGMSAAQIAAYVEGGKRP